MKKTLLTLIATLGLVGLLQSCANTNNTQAENPNPSPSAEVAKQEPTQEKPAEPVPQFDETKGKRLTDTAKLLAGMKVDENSEFAGIQKREIWQAHQNTLNNSWSQLDKQQLSKVRTWSDQQLTPINSTSPQVFYPFSGADFLYAYSLFPKGKEYVMIGLEPVGKVPDFSKLSTGQINQQLVQARNALYALLQFSFFRTNDMKNDMAQQGVLPAIFIFMARTNNQILDLEYVGVDKDGNIQKMADGMVPGVKISFLPQGETTPRTLYYFSTDLSNDGFQKNPQFAEFIKKMEKPVTYLKAASYLMYNESFSDIKNMITDNSSYVLQDDSGMPLKFFDKEKWDLTFYGNYTQPIGLFSNRYQSDLRKVYQTDKDIKPLNFGIGYKFGVNESNLMLAQRK